VADDQTTPFATLRDVPHLLPPVAAVGRGYNSNMVTENSEHPAEEAIELKDPALAALLAWLIPGLGHWYQGRRAKAVLYFVCIMGLFGYGVYLSSSNLTCFAGKGTIGYGRAVYFSWRDGDHRLNYLGQIGVGLAALPALVQANRMGNHQKVWWGGFMAPPRLPAASVGEEDDPNFDQPTPQDLYRQLHYYFDLAGFFTVVAGLLNVLAIYDAWAGPVVAPPAEDKDEKEESDV
jgi:hypothetical protein